MRDQHAHHPEGGWPKRKGADEAQQVSKEGDADLRLHTVAGPVRNDHMNTLHVLR